MPRAAGVENTGMSFQAYLDNIKAKTGKSPDDFRALAVEAGVLKVDMKAGELVAWLKKEFDLGHGHSMALWAVFKNNGWVRAEGRKATGGT
jgi:hypothetical protein